MFKDFLLLLPSSGPGTDPSIAPAKPGLPQAKKNSRSNGPTGTGPKFVAGVNTLSGRGQKLQPGSLPARVGTKNFI